VLEGGHLVGPADDDDAGLGLGSEPATGGEAGAEPVPVGQEEGAAPKTTKRGSRASPTKSWRTETPAAAVKDAPTDAPIAAARVRGTSGSPNP